MIATKRRLFDSDDSASMVKRRHSTCDHENSVMAGIRKRFCVEERRAAGNRHLQEEQQHRRQQVTPRRSAAGATSLPATYSTRVSGFDR